MIRPAILYKDEIVASMQEWYYTDSMLYYTGSIDNCIPEIAESDEYGPGRYDWAVIERESNVDTVIGYISYRVDFYTGVAYNFGIFSFDRGNLIFVDDLNKILKSLLDNPMVHKLEWRAVSGNPAVRAYDKFCKDHNGVKHILKNDIRDVEGNFHDDIIYEVFKE